MQLDLALNDLGEAWNRRESGHRGEEGCEKPLIVFTTDGEDKTPLFPDSDVNLPLSLYLNGKLLCTKPANKDLAALEAENKRLTELSNKMFDALGGKECVIAQQAERIKELERKLNESKSNN